MEFKITKQKYLGKSGGSWDDFCDWYLIHGRMINDDDTMFRRFKFVACVNYSADGWDDELECDRDPAEMLEESIACFTDLLYGVDFDDVGKIQEFIDACNETIMDYNRGRYYGGIRV